MSRGTTHFDVFELPRSYSLDPQELERRYRERSRVWHPDRFSRAPASERAAVLQRATDLNEAYRVLRSDTRRAEYLLKLAGVDVNQEAPGGQPALDPAFLASVLELREELMEARAEEDAARLARIEKQVHDELAEIKQRLSAGFARLESGDSGGRSALPDLVHAVLTQRYYQRFLDDIAAHAEARQEAEAARARTT
jgi:molecular chaperone HscB